MIELKKDLNEILEKFLKTLENVPTMNEEYYLIDNVNTKREDIAISQNPEKIMKNAKTDKDGNLIVKKADWVN